jgi:hypothetical protein
MVNAHTGGRVSRGVRAAVLVVLASVGLPASAAATPAAAGLTITPLRIAIVVFENKD